MKYVLKILNKTYQFHAVLYSREVGNSTNRNNLIFPGSSLILDAKYKKPFEAPIGQYDNGEWKKRS